MLESAMRGIPLAWYWPLRRVLHRHRHRHPARVLATLMLRRAARAYRGHLANRMTQVRPLDRPDLTFVSVDSMVMDAVYWFGVRGYEGTVARTWAALCAQADSVLEVGGNIGLFTVVGAKAGPGRYTVVEPVPSNAGTLRANLLGNSLTAVEVLEAAVVPGEVERDVTLNVPSEGRDMPVGAHMLDQVEIAARGSAEHITVRGLPMQGLALGRDLIKIDAEGIEAALLSGIRPLLLERRPTLLVEVLPEATALGRLLSDLAVEAGYTIHVLPEYGSDETVAVDAASFTAALPSRYNSKDVVLHRGALPLGR